MITAIIIISLAFIWLGKESDWLRVRLPVGVPFLDVEIDETGYDGNDGLSPDDLEDARQEAIENFKYDQWLAKRYAPKYSYGSLPNSRKQGLNVDDDLAQRRAGVALYQRFGKTPQYAETALGGLYKW